MRIDHESLIGTYEQKRAQVQKFNLMHDNFFAIVMQHKEALETVLRILLQRNDLCVREVRVQYSMRNLVGHSSVLDVLAEDHVGKLYNIEVQVRNEDDYQKRSRFYQSGIDTGFLEKGRHYKDLPEVYLIFITAFDLFGDGLVSYEVQRVLKSSGRVVDNGVHELYFNAKATDDTEVSRLLQYFMHTDPEETGFGSLSDTVRHYKNTEEGVSHVCDEVKRYGDERAAVAAERAKAEARVQLVSNLMQNMNCTLEQALKNLGISWEEYQGYIDCLSHRESA